MGRVGAKIAVRQVIIHLGKLAMIPQVLHFLLLDVEAGQYEGHLQTWSKLNPEYKIHIWDQDKLRREAWYGPYGSLRLTPYNISLVREMLRYQILFQYGGVIIDESYVCLRPLEGWLLDTNFFAAYENEYIRPGLISSSVVGAVQGTEFFKIISKRLEEALNSSDSRLPKSMGANFLTERIYSVRPGITIYPSHYFFPVHFSGFVYNGSGQIFAKHFPIKEQAALSL